MPKAAAPNMASVTSTAQVASNMAANQLARSEARRRTFQDLSRPDFADKAAHDQPVNAANAFGVGPQGAGEDLPPKPKVSRVGLCWTRFLAPKLGASYPAAAI